MSQRKLPDEFADLELFAARWAVPEETQRREIRVSGQMKDIQAFYDAMVRRIDDILSYLNMYELGKLQPEATTLMYLCLALAEVSPAVELYKQPDVAEGFATSRFAPVKVAGMTPDI
jgi:hypothetical protein